MARFLEEPRVLSSRVKYRQKRELFLFRKILKVWARVHSAELGVTSLKQLCGQVAGCTDRCISLELEIGTVVPCHMREGWMLHCLSQQMFIRVKWMNSARCWKIGDSC